MLEIAIYAAGLALLFAELFIPGGILGIAGLGMVVYAIGSAWYSGDVESALPMTLLTLVALPAMFTFATKRLKLSADMPSDEGYSAADDSLEALQGREGVAITPLRPSGMVQIDDERVSVVAEAGLIDKDMRVRVVEVEGNRVVVRAV